MPDSFFSQFFEQPPSQGAGTAQRKPESKRETPTAAPISTPQPPGLAEKIAALEAELAKTKEKALSYELRMKEMENARASVEEMFEKLWAKASKERMEDELRAIRERSVGRVEALEKRLDDFQKAFLDLLRDWKGEPRGQQEPQPVPKPQSEDPIMRLQKIEAALERLETLKPPVLEPVRASEPKPSEASKPSVEDIENALKRIDSILNKGLKGKGQESGI